MQWVKGVRKINIAKYICTCTICTLSSCTFKNILAMYMKLVNFNII